MTFSFFFSTRVLILLLGLRAHVCGRTVQLARLPAVHAMSKLMSKFMSISCQLQLNDAACLFAALASLGAVAARTRRLPLFRFGMIHGRLLVLLLPPSMLGVASRCTYRRFGHGGAVERKTS